MNKLIVIGLIIRILMVIYSDFHDSNFKDKMTDIDYSVYTDGAKYVLNGASPFQRHTYRYTPLLSYMMIPNLILFQSFGKLVFVLFDILVAILINKITKLVDPSTTVFQTNLIIGSWLFNPLVLSISSRGNADTVITFLAILTIYLVLTKRYFWAGLIYGLTVHFKIYPIIWSLVFYFHIDNSKPKTIYIFTKNRIIFAIISATTFLALLATFHHFYGYQFLYEYLLYHGIRKDNRTNFSIYFYYIHLNFRSVTQLQSVMAFLPQLLILVTGTFMYRDLLFAVFFQTFFFVLFNKVCAAQYFIWYTSLLPLILKQNRLFQSYKIVAMAVIWLITEVSWNLFNFLIENQGFNAFIGMFCIDWLFFVVNLVIGTILINNHCKSDHLYSKL